MLKKQNALSAALTLTGLALWATPEAGARSIALAQRANDALGLAHSSVGELRTLSSTADGVRLGLEIPGAPVVLNLVPHSVRAPGFEARGQLDDGSWIVLPEEPVRTYHGTVLGHPDSLVAASLLDDGLHARIRWTNGDEQWIEPLERRLGADAAGLHAFYSNDDVLDTQGSCGADLLPPIFVSVPPTGNGPLVAAGGATVTAEIACDADFEYFSDHGSGTQARIESVINALNLQYASDVGITHQITTVLIRMSSNDPYSRKGASQLLSQFRNEWNSNQGGVQRDVAHLFTGRNLSGSTIGIAYIGAVCNLNVAYGLVESDFASNFACTTDLSAHELGHNWSADHCSCSGFTMNASITCANQFSPTATIPQIIAYRDAQTCFGPPPTTGSVAGTITSTADGSPISGATVQADSGQSATTAGNGSYTITDVPTGNRTVTASAAGFDAASTNVNVTENNTSTADLALDPAPVGSQAIVECITYRSQGGPNQDRNLFIDILITDDAGNPVAGATVSASVDLDGSPFGTASATTDSAGEVTFQAKNSPNGCFATDVTGVSAAGLSFDGSEPANGFAKGSDASPDPDCRTSNDPCGAG